VHTGEKERRPKKKNSKEGKVVKTRGTSGKTNNHPRAKHIATIRRERRGKQNIWLLSTGKKGHREEPNSNPTRGKRTWRPGTQVLDRRKPQKKKKRKGQGKESKLRAKRFKSTVRQKKAPTKTKNPRRFGKKSLKDEKEGKVRKKRSRPTRGKRPNCQTSNDGLQKEQSCPQKGHHEIERYSSLTRGKVRGGGRSNVFGGKGNNSLNGKTLKQHTGNTESGKGVLRRSATRSSKGERKK